MTQGEEGTSKESLLVGSAEHAIRVNPQDLPYCAVEVDKISDDGVVTKAAARTPTCFRTLAEVTNFASGGAIQLAADATSLDVSLLRSASPSLTARYIVGIEYENSGGGGSHHEFYSDATCATHTFTYDHLGSIGWGDRISSARAYSGCNHSYHYEDAGFKGGVYDCKAYCPSMGALNDETSSIKWTK